MSRPLLAKLVAQPAMALALLPLLITTACFDREPPSLNIGKKGPHQITISGEAIRTHSIDASDPRFQSNDPVQRRAAVMEMTTDELYSVLSLRFKIIQSRALILYLSDILPAQGSPYKHMADFAGISTKNAFNAAQKNNSKFMNTDEFGYWLPLEEGQKVSAKDLADEETAAIYKYFAQYIATATVMRDIIQPVIKNSIVVESIEESSGPEVKQQFDKTWDHIENIVKQYSQLFAASDLTKNMASEMKPKVMVAMMAAIADGMKNHISVVQNQNNQYAINEFINSLSKLTEEQDFSTSKQEIKTLFDAQSASFGLVKSSLESVDLPDSGSIDGSDDAFETVMRLELGFDILKKLASEIQNK